MMVDIKTLDVDAMGTDNMDNTMDIDANPDSTKHSIPTDMAYISEGHNAVFPCTIWYMDLTILKLKYLYQSVQAINNPIDKDTKQHGQRLDPINAVRDGSVWEHEAQMRSTCNCTLWKN